MSPVLGAWTGALGPTVVLGPCALVIAPALAVNLADDHWFVRVSLTKQRQKTPLAKKRKMFDSKMMVETTEEQPAAEAAMMASAMAGRADAFGGGAIGSSDEMLPAKTVSRQFHSASKRKNDR